MRTASGFREGYGLPRPTAPRQILLFRTRRSVFSSWLLLWSYFSFSGLHFSRTWNSSASSQYVQTHRPAQGPCPCDYRVRDETGAPILCFPLWWGWKCQTLLPECTFEENVRQHSEISASDDTSIRTRNRTSKEPANGERRKWKRLGNESKCEVTKTSRQQWDFEQPALRVWRSIANVEERQTLTPALLTPQICSKTRTAAKADRPPSLEWNYHNLSNSLASAHARQPIPLPPVAKQIALGIPATKRKGHHRAALAAPAAAAGTFFWTSVGTGLPFFPPGRSPRDAQGPRKRRSRCRVRPPPPAALPLALQTNATGLTRAHSAREPRNAANEWRRWRKEKSPWHPRPL
jgi:hypothetical protein